MSNYLLMNLDASVRTYADVINVDRKVYELLPAQWQSRKLVRDQELPSLLRPLLNDRGMSH